MAVTREEALRQLVGALEEISAKLNRSHTVSVGARQVIIDITGIISELKLILTELQSQSTTLSSIDGKDFATQTTLSLVEGKDFATETTLLTRATQATLAAVETLVTTTNSLLTTIDTVLDVIKTNTDPDDGTMTVHLNSIDDNIGGLFGLLATNIAILAAVINNATSGRQDTAQVSFDAMVIDTDDTANRLAILIGQFEQKWSRTYTCTAAGSLTLTFSVPASDYWRKISFGFFPIIAANRIASVVRGDAGGGRIIPLDGITTLTTLVNRMIPNTGASSARAPMDRWQANATETYVLTISTPAIGDIIVIEMVADKLNATNIATPVVGGTGTFTTGAEVRSVVTRF